MIPIDCVYENGSPLYERLKLAVGVSFAMLSINIGVAASIIGLTTFFCCIVALFIQKGVGRVLGDKAAIVGGIVLICIGIKALLS